MNPNHPPMLDIASLRPHEQTDPIRLEDLKKQLRNDGYQRDPIIVDEKHLIVLDGHHRILALKALGYHKVVAHKIRYVDNNEITLRTWHSAVKGSRSRLLDALQNYLEDPKEQNEKTEHPILILNDRQYTLKASRKTIMDSLLGRFKIEYIPDAETARELAKRDDYSGAIVFQSIDKGDVVKAALSGSVLPPKTTQHIVPNKPTDWFIPLEILGNGVETEPTRNVEDPQNQKFPDKSRGYSTDIKIVRKTH